MHPQYLQSCAYVGAKMQTYQNKHVHTYFMKKTIQLVAGCRLMPGLKSKLQYVVGRNEINCISNMARTVISTLI